MLRRTRLRSADSRRRKSSVAKKIPPKLLWSRGFYHSYPEAERSVQTNKYSNHELCSLAEPAVYHALDRRRRRASRLGLDRGHRGLTEKYGLSPTPAGQADPKRLPCHCKERAWYQSEPDRTFDLTSVLSEFGRTLLNGDQNKDALTTALGTGDNRYAPGITLKRHHHTDAEGKCNLLCATLPKQRDVLR